MNASLSAKRLLLMAAGLWLAARIAYALLTIGWFFFFAQGHHVPDVIALWKQWDTGWYLQIAKDGYASRESTAFFPLYPSLIFLANLALGGGDSTRLVAALVISNLGALMAFYALALLAANENGEAAAAPSVRMLATYPLATFLVAAYSDGIFLALATIALLLARRGRFGWAAAAAFAATLARPTGIVLILPLAYEIVRRSGFHLRPATLLRLALPAAPVAAFAAYAGYMLYRFGEPLVFLKVQGEHWGRHVLPPWETLWLAIEHFGGQEAWDLVPFVGLLAVTIAAARQQPIAFTLYMGGLLYLAIAAPEVGNADIVHSAGRFLIAAAPAFIALGSWTMRRPWLHFGLGTAGSLFQAINAIAFFQGQGAH